MAPVHPPSLLRALSRVLDRTGFPYGSGDRLFRDAWFGRDALEVAEDLLTCRPDIVRAVIRGLASLQGARLDPVTEEEPGKIHHEYRALVMHGRPVRPESAAILRSLAAGAGFPTSAREYVSYATVDATPIYVRLVARYCRYFGAGILNEEYEPRHPSRAERRPVIGDSVLRAVNWVAHRVRRSDIGLLEFQRMTPHGPRFQAWKDGGTSYLHPDGQLANYDAPIASVEVQGLAYDALTEGARVLNLSATKREELLELAGNLQQATLDHFWMPRENYFAMAVDRHPVTLVPRQVGLITSNPGALLDTSILETLPDGDRRYYTAAIVRRIYNHQFLTPVGIRCTSLVHATAYDYPAYQSSYTVWPRETHDIAKGLERQGFHALAFDLENRLLNAVNLNGAPAEFFYVMGDGRVAYHPESASTEDESEEIEGTNVPEEDQAWTISAALAIKVRRGRRTPPLPSKGWQSELEAELESQVVPVRLLRTRAELAGAASKDRFHVNTSRGWEREKQFIHDHPLGSPA